MINKITIIILICISLLMVERFVQAQKPVVGDKVDTTQSDKKNNTKPVELDDPLGMEKELANGTAINILIGKIINSVLGVVGSIALAMFVWYGILWMTSAGNSDQVQKGKNGIIWSTIGLIVIFSAYAMVKFILGGIGAS